MPLYLRYAYRDCLTSETRTDGLEKTRYESSNSESPLLHPIKDKNKFLCPNDYSKESGYALEFFLIDNYEELKHLKKPNINLFPLSAPEYWNDINFNKLKEFNKKIMSENQKVAKNITNNEDDLDMLYYDKRTNIVQDERIGCVF